jgi:hypothetical protein
MDKFREHKIQKYKLSLRAMCIIAPIVFLVCVVYDFSGRPYILDDFGFSQIIKNNGPINTMVDLGTNREGRFLSPFTLL